MQPKKRLLISVIHYSELYVGTYIVGSKQAIYLRDTTLHHNWQYDLAIYTHNTELFECEIAINDFTLLFYEFINNILLDMNYIIYEDDEICELEYIFGAVLN